MPTRGNNGILLFTARATENNRPVRAKRDKVRVKMCGKSARAHAAMHAWGKPYREQDKIGVCGRLCRLNTRVCRIDK